MDRNSQIINSLDLGDIAIIVVKYDFFFKGKEKFVINEGMNFVKEFIKPISGNRVVYISTYRAKILNLQTGIIDTNNGKGFFEIATNDHLIATSSDDLLQIVDFNTRHHIRDLVIPQREKLFFYDKYLLRYKGNTVIKWDFVIDEEVIYDANCSIKQLLVVNDKLICISYQKIVVLNLYTGELIHTYQWEGYYTCIHKLDEHHLIICYSKHTEMYNVNEATSQNIFEGQSGISKLYILSDKRIITLSYGSLVIWKNMHEIELTLSDRGNQFINVLPNENIITNDGNTFNVWDSSSGRLIHTFSIRGHDFYAVKSIAVSDGGQLVVIFEGKEEELSFIPAFKKGESGIIVFE